MCKCDGIDYTSLALGQPATITAYGKVEGVEQNYAKITDFKFLFIKGNDPTKQDIVIPQTTVPAVIALQNDQMTRYKADWTIDLPSNLSTADTYRITAKMTCVRKAQAALPNVQTNRVVLGSTTQPPVSLWDRVVGFFANLFGGGQGAVAVPTPTPTLTPEQQKQLQLKTFIPARGISTDNCTFIRFNF